jgi:WD40 repeat protein
VQQRIFYYSDRQEPGGIRPPRLFHPDGRQVLTCYGPTVRVWDRAAGQPVPVELSPEFRSRELRQGDAPPSWAAEASLAVTDGRRLATAADNEVVLRDLTTGRPLAPALKHAGPVVAVTFNADGTRLATRTARTARVWDTAGGRPLCPPLEHESVLAGFAFTPAGRLAVETAAGKVTAWDIETGTRCYPPRDGWIPDTRRPGEVRYFLTAAVPGGDALQARMRVRDASTGEPASPPLPGGPDGGVAIPGFSPDGHRMVTASNQSQVWDVRSGKPLGEPFPNGFVRFSPDGRRVLTLEGNAARLWDAETGRALTPPMPHEALRDACFSSDGALLCTADWTVVRVWEAGTGAPLTPLLKFSAGEALAPSLAFSPDGRRLAAALPGRTFLWDLSPDERPVEELKRLAALLSGRRIDDGGALAAAPVQAEVWREWSARHPDELGASAAQEWAWLAAQTRYYSWHEDQAAEAEYLARLIERDADNAALYYRRALANGKRGRHAECDVDAARADRLQPLTGGMWAELAELPGRPADRAEADYDQALKRQPDSAALWAGRGRRRAARGRLAEAAADLAQAAERDPNETAYHSELALLRLATDDRAGYRRACAAMADRFLGGEDLSRVSAVAAACVLAPDAGVDRARLRAPLEALPAQSRDVYEDARKLLLLAALDYREGRFKEAAERLARLDESKLSEENRIERLLFQALTDRRLGKADPARDGLGRAVRALEARKDASWPLRLRLGLLRREAEEAIEGKGKP